MSSLSNPLLVDKLTTFVIREDLIGIRTFLSMGVSPYACGVRGDTPLMVAAEGNIPQILTELIAVGGDVNLRDAGGKTALMRALLWNNKATETVRILLEAGAECERPDNRGYYISDFTMMAALREWEVHSALEFDRLHLDIIRAAKQGDQHTLAKSLRRSVPRRILTNALLLAISNGNEECCRLLLAEGADANGFDIYGAQPLPKAVAYLHVEIARLLLAHGAEVNGKSTELEKTPLIEACVWWPEGKDFDETEKARYAMVDLLIREGADVTYIDKCGCSAFEQAENLDIILLLLKNGACS